MDYFSILQGWFRICHSRILNQCFNLKLLSVSNISGSESHTFYIVGLCLLGFAGSVALFMPFFVFIQVGIQNESHIDHGAKIGWPSNEISVWSTMIGLVTSISKSLSVEEK